MFSPYELDTDKLVLLKDGVDQKVGSQVYSILEILVENRDRIVSKQELIDRVWDGRFVSANNIDSRIRATRAAIGDDGTRQDLIKTFNNRGFRFIAKVTPEDGTSAGAAFRIYRSWLFLLAIVGLVAAALIASVFLMSTSRAPSSGTVHGDVIPKAKPVIVLLPFQGHAGHAPSETLAESLTLELRRAFTTMPDVRFISSAVLANADISPDQFGTFYQEFDVDYIVSGRLSATDQTSRLYVEFADARTGVEEWSETVDFVTDGNNPLETSMRLSERVSAQIAGKLGLPAPLPSFEYNNTAAYAHYLKAEQLMRGAKPETLRESISELEKALEIDPNFASAHAALVGNYNLAVGLLGMSEEESREKMSYHFDRAMDINPNNVVLLSAAAQIALRESRTEDALEYYNKAIIAAPNGKGPYFRKANTLLLLARHEESVAAYEEALKFDPTLASALFNLTLLKINLGDFDEAAVLAERNVTWNGDKPAGLHALGLVKMHQGQYVEAHTYFAQGLTVNPRDIYIQIDLMKMYIDLGITDAGQTLITYPAWNTLLKTYSGDVQSAADILESSRRPINTAYLGYYAQDYVAALEATLTLTEQLAFAKPAPPFGKTDLKKAATFAYTLKQNSSAVGDQIVNKLADYYANKTPDQLHTPDEFDGAMALAMLQGDPETALDWLEAAHDRGFIFAKLHYEPLFAPLQSLPRYGEIMQSVRETNDVITDEIRQQIADLDRPE